MDIQQSQYVYKCTNAEAYKKVLISIKQCIAIDQETCA